MLQCLLNYVIFYVRLSDETMIVLLHKVLLDFHKQKDKKLILMIFKTLEYNQNLLNIIFKCYILKYLFKAALQQIIKFKIKEECFYTCN